MNCLISNGIVEPYQPLMDIEGSYSAQFEHVSLSVQVLAFMKVMERGLTMVKSRLFSYARRIKRFLAVEMTTETTFTAR